MLDERKTAILRAVVEEYIETAQPVGSGSVAPQVQASSATVRNDMALLEQEGYLHQPHTSAGRVPTEKGYRLFVDTMVAPGQLPGEQSQQVRSFFARTHGELEGLLHDTSRLLSDLTQYAAVVTGPTIETATVRSVQLVGLAPRHALAVVVLSNGSVAKHGVDFAVDTTDAELVGATAHLASHLVGLSAGALPDHLPPTGAESVDAAVAAALAALAHAGGPGDEGPVFVGGTARMASAFDAVDTVREVLSILEQQFVVVTVLRDVIDRGLQVAIGSETGLIPLAECALVVSPYQVEGEHAGTIGVLGPSRMNYAQALAAVAVVSKRLGKHLTEG
jgi:heat-inducible transcriptional repressor